MTQSFEPVTDVSQCRPQVQRAALILENHLREKAFKGPVMGVYSLIEWYEKRVLDGFYDLDNAIQSGDAKEIEHRSINAFTRLYYVMLLNEMLGSGE